ncbi:MAG: hypothetical protein ACK5XV_08070 [Flavobacteriales bacterium]
MCLDRATSDDESTSKKSCVCAFFLSWLPCKKARFAVFCALFLVCQHFLGVNMASEGKLLLDELFARCLSRREIAKLLKIHIATVNNWQKRDEVPPCKQRRVRAILWPSLMGASQDQASLSDAEGQQRSAEEIAWAITRLARSLK